MLNIGKMIENGCMRKKPMENNRHLFPAFSLPMACFLVAILATVSFINSLNGDFVFDDTEAILNNEDVKPDTPIAQLFHNDFWGTSLKHNNSHKSYRPLTVLSFRLNYILRGELRALDYHLTNLVLHSLISTLSTMLFMLIYGENLPRLSFISAVIFAIHPVHTESVAGIVGRADLLCSLFYFFSFFLYVKYLQNGYPRYFLISMFCCTISMLCKEQGITVLGVNAVYDLVIILRFNIHHISYQISTYKCIGQRYLLMAFVGVALLYGRLTVMGSTTPVFQQVDNPASFASSLMTRILTYNYVYSIHALLLVFPHWLCFDWSMGCIPLVTNVLDPRNLASLFLWIVFLSATYKALFSSSFQQRRYLTLGLGLVVIPFLPASNVFFRVGFVVAERILFIPVAGCCTLVIYGIERLNSIYPCSKLWRVCLMIVLVCYGLKSYNRSLEWTDESKLFRSGLKVCPLNAKVHYNIAKNAADQGDRDFAIAEYGKALELNPEYDQAMNNLANLLKDLGEVERAEKLLLKAVRVRQDFAAAWMNLGIVQAIRKKYEEARTSYLTALSHRKKYPDCYYNLGNLYLELQRYNEAYEAFRSATILQPNHVLAWTNLIVMLDNTGQTTRAETVAHQALKILPNEPNLHFSLAGMLGKQGRFEESESHFKAALRMKPDNPTYHTNLGVLYHRWKKYDEAEKCYFRALTLEPGLKSATENLKLLYKAKSKIS